MQPRTTSSCSAAVQALRCLAVKAARQQGPRQALHLLHSVPSKGLWDTAGSSRQQ